MGLLKRNSTINLRDHVGVELAALSLVTLIGVGLTAWQAARTARHELDSRTRARLLPPGQRTQQGAEAN